jgi:hypothetical protein
MLFGLLASSSTAFAKTKTYSCGVMGEKGAVVSISADIKTGSVSHMVTKIPNGWDDKSNTPKYKVVNPFKDTSTYGNGKVFGKLVKDGEWDIIYFTDNNGLLTVPAPRIEYHPVKEGTYWTNYNKNNLSESRFFLSCVTNLI